MSLVILVVLVLIVSMLSCTKEQRQAARERMKPIGRALWIPLAVFWAMVILTWPQGR